MGQSTLFELRNRRQYRQYLQEQQELHAAVTPSARADACRVSDTSGDAAAAAVAAAKAEGLPVGMPATPAGSSSSVADQSVEDADAGACCSTALEAQQLDRIAPPPAATDAALEVDVGAVQKSGSTRPDVVAAIQATSGHSSGDTCADPDNAHTASPAAPHAAAISTPSPVKHVALGARHASCPAEAASQWPGANELAFGARGNVPPLPPGWALPSETASIGGGVGCGDADYLGSCGVQPGRGHHAGWPLPPPVPLNDVQLRSTVKAVINAARTAPYVSRHRCSTVSSSGLIRK
jgi:hypothetical protein